MTGSVGSRPNDVGAQRQVSDDPVGQAPVEGDPKFIKVLLDSFPEFAIHNKSVPKKGGGATGTGSAGGAKRLGSDDGGPPTPDIAPGSPKGMRQMSDTASSLGAMSTTGGSEPDPLSSVMASMLAMQKMLNKEAREDRKIVRTSNKIKLVASEKKAKLDMKKIDGG